MKKTRSSLQAWTLSAGLPLVFKWRLNAPAGFEVCTWDSCHSPLSVFSNPSFHVAPQSLRGKRENFLQEFFVFGFFSCSLVWTSIHMDHIFRAPSGRCAFRRVPFKCEDFLKTRNQSFWCSSFLFKRFFFRGSKSLNSIRCWKLLLPLITSDILNSIFQTQPSRMVIKSVGWASSSSRQGIQCNYRQLTDWNLQFWSWGVKLA